MSIGSPDEIVSERDVPGVSGGNPSSWSHRWPVLLLALVGAAVATYLTLYQWNRTASVWDPIFSPASSEAVLTSAISRYLPLPDATLGAIAYVAEAILTALGGSARWRTTPWLVIVFGLALAGLAVTSLALVLTQIFLVRAFCTLCLCSAGISFVNAWLGRDEVLATLASLRQSIATGASWREALRGPLQVPAGPARERTAA